MKSYFKHILRELHIWNKTKYKFYIDGEVHRIVKNTEDDYAIIDKFENIILQGSNIFTYISNNKQYICCVLKSNWYYHPDCEECVTITKTYLLENQKMTLLTR